MPTLLFGTDDCPIRVASGEFFCPQCREARSYQRTQVRRTLVVFAVPIGSLGRRGEYVECLTCLATFRPEVLAYDAGAETGTVMAEYQRAMRRVLALMVMVDGRIREAEIAIVREIFESVSGIPLTRSEVLREVEEVRREPVTVARFLGRVAGYLNEYGKEQVLRAVALVSRADGEVHAREADMVRRLGGVMRVAPERIERLAAPA